MKKNITLTLIGCLCLLIGFIIGQKYFADTPKDTNFDKGNYTSSSSENTEPSPTQEQLKAEQDF
ncbi:hypothetical protein BH09PAT3_BH09PAT3_5660 [soil metagenome]